MARWAIALTGAAVALASAVVVVAARVDAAGRDFFITGQAIAQQLGRFGTTLAGGDAAALAAFFTDTFRGTRLGLSHRTLIDTRDGIRRWRIDPAIDATDAAASAREWRDYVATFDAIDRIELHLDRLERWDHGADAVAVVRFELEGVPRGERRSGIDRGVLRLSFAGLPSAPTIASAALVRGERILADTPQFRNVAADAGIDFENRYYPAFLDRPLPFGMIRYGPAGLTAVDYDNDGFTDLFIPDGVQSRLFRNTHDGRFVDVTAIAGLAGLDGVSVAVFGDYDNDGFKDVFVSRTFKPNQLFHNNGDGTFADVTARAGLGADCCTTTAAWADYDNDGDLDLYVGRYLDPRMAIPTTFYARNGEPNQLYENRGDSTFVNVTANAGVGDTGLCLATVWGDYDDDGYPDLFVVNDFGRSTLYHNDRNRRFTDVTVRAGALAYGAGMSASFVDFDNDGRFDLYTTDIRSNSSWFAEPPTVARYMLNSFRQGVWRTDMPLYFQIFRQSGVAFTAVFREMAAGNHLLRNRGDGTFEDVAAAVGADPPGWFWGAAFADFNNDAWVDVYLADGWVKNDPDTEIELDFLNNVVTRQADYKTGLFFDPAHFGRRSWHGWEANRFLASNRDGRFTEMAHATGTDLLLNSRGVAVADFWNRGVLDIAVAASGDRHALLKNELPSRRHWLGVELVGTQSNRDAVGARIVAAVGGSRQSREVVLGDGYGSQSTLRQHFGLDAATSVETLTVKWPRSGLVQTFRNVAADRVVRIVEGRDELLGVEPAARGSR